MGEQERPHLFYAVTNLRRIMTTPRVQPVIEALTGRSNCLAGLPRHNSILLSKLAADGDQSKTLCHPFHLTVRASRHKLFSKCLHDWNDLFLYLINVGHDSFEKLSGRNTIVLPSCISQMTRKRVTGRKAVKVFKHPNPEARIGGDVNDAHLLTGR